MELIGYKGKYAFMCAVKRSMCSVDPTSPLVCYLVDGSAVSVGINEGPGFNPTLYGAFGTKMAYQDAVRAGLLHRVPSDPDW